MTVKESLTLALVPLLSEMVSVSLWLPAVSPVFGRTVKVAVPPDARVAVPLSNPVPAVMIYFALAGRLTVTLWLPVFSIFTVCAAGAVV